MLALGIACDPAAPEALGSNTGDTGVDPCADAAITTWETFGAGFVTQHCQPCHASTTNERQGAPDTVTFDTEEEVLAQADRILARATGDDPDMPPEGGVGADDRYLLEVWLSCE